MKRDIIKVILILLCYSFAFAGNENTDHKILKVGMYFDYLLNSHNISDFKGFSNNVPNCCDNFESLSNQGFNVGLCGEIMFDDMFGLHLRLGYSDISALFKLDNKFIGYQQDINNRLISLYSNHRLDTKINTVIIQPSLIIKAPSLPFKLLIGLESGMMITKTYEQTEEMTDETKLTGFVFSYEQGTMRNVGSGDIPNANSIFLNTILTLKYDLNLLKRLAISPEIGYSFGLTNLAKDINWKVNNLRVGISVYYSLGSGKRVCPDGFTMDENGNCIAIKKSINCPEGFHLDENGNCVKDEVPCPEGYIKNSVGDCVPKDVQKFDKCCYILYSSVKDESEAKRLLDILINNTVESPRIQKITDKGSGKTIFRVISGCYKTIPDAYQAMEKYSKIIESMGLKELPIVKCD